MYLLLSLAGVICGSNRDCSECPLSNCTRHGHCKLEGDKCVLDCKTRFPLEDEDGDANNPHFFNHHRLCDRINDGGQPQVLATLKVGSKDFVPYSPGLGKILSKSI